MALPEIHDPIQRNCRICGERFTISAERHGECLVRGWRLPRKCQRCQRILWALKHHDQRFVDDDDDPDQPI